MILFLASPNYIINYNIKINISSYIRWTLNLTVIVYQNNYLTNPKYHKINHSNSRYNKLRAKIEKRWLKNTCYQKNHQKLRLLNIKGWQKFVVSSNKSEQKVINSTGPQKKRGKQKSMSNNFTKTDQNLTN